MTQRTVDALNLKPIGEEHMVIKTFGSTAEKPMKVKMFELVIKSKAGMNLYLKAYSVPTICSSLTGQEVRVARKKFPDVTGYAVCNQGEEVKQEIDLLIGSDYYWTIITNDIRRCDEVGLAAINSKLGWILSGPVSNKVNSSVINYTHDEY